MPRIYFKNNEGLCSSYLLEVKRFNDFFVANGYDVVEDPKRADTIFVTTCVSFDADEDRSIEDLQAMAQYDAEVIAYGCLTTYNAERTAEVHHGPVVTAINPEQVEMLVPDLKVPLADIPHHPEFRVRSDYRNYDPTKRFVNINFGCYFSCTFCAHKLGIGGSRSRPLADIVAQIEAMRNENVRVVMLNGLDTGGYGMDIGSSFPELLQAVLDINDDFEVYIRQFNPTWAVKYEQALLPLVSNARVTSLQVPFQSTSERLLKLMRRPRQVRQIGRFMTALHDNNPGCVRQTDMIVGFPTETWEELMDSVAFAVHNFDEAAVYAFEMKQGVPLEAMGLPEHSDEEKQRRVEYATRTLADAGRLHHRGGQALLTLQTVEQGREALRQRNQLHTADHCGRSNDELYGE